MSDFTFKQIGKNEYETFYGVNSIHIFFKVPDGCKIEDYNITENTERGSGIQGNFSKAAYFEFTTPPDGESMASISPLAGLNFLNKSYIKVEDLLILGDNKDVSIDFKDGASPCFNTLNFRNNKEMTFIFTPSSFEKISEEELNDSGFYSSGITTIEENANLTLTLGDNTIIDNIFSCGASSYPGSENKVDLSKIKFLDCQKSHAYPKTNNFTIAVECDIFKISKTSLCTDGRAKRGGTRNLLKNKHEEKGVLNSIVLENADIIFEDTGSLIVGTKELYINRGPQDRNMNFKKINEMSAKEKITLMGSRCENCQITSDNGYIEVFHSRVVDTTIHFSDAGDESNNGILDNASIYYSDLKKINGIIAGDFRNCKADNVTFGDKSSIQYVPMVISAKDRWLELENVVLIQGVFLDLSSLDTIFSPLKRISNSNIEGDLKIKNNVNYAIESSVLKAGELTIQMSDKGNSVAINNSILEGDSTFLNVSELSCSELRDSKILLDMPTKISNQFFYFNDIKDYGAHLCNQAQNFTEVDSQMSSNTETLESL